MRGVANETPPSVLKEHAYSTELHQESGRARGKVRSRVQTILNIEVHTQGAQ